MFWTLVVIGAWPIFGVAKVLLHTLHVESFEYLRTGYGAALTESFCRSSSG